MFDWRESIAAEIVDVFAAEELPSLVQRDARLLMYLRERNPGVVGKLAPWKSIVLSTLDQWDGDTILDTLYDLRPAHYRALASTPGGFDWFRRQVEDIQTALPALLGASR